MMNQGFVKSQLINTVEKMKNLDNNTPMSTFSSYLEIKALLLIWVFLLLWCFSRSESVSDASQNPAAKDAQHPWGLYVLQPHPCESDSIHTVVIHSLSPLQHCNNCIFIYWHSHYIIDVAIFLQEWLRHKIKGNVTISVVRSFPTLKFSINVVLPRSVHDNFKCSDGKQESILQVFQLV